MKYTQHCMVDDDFSNQSFIHLNLPARLAGQSKVFLSEMICKLLCQFTSTLEHLQNPT